MATPLKQVNKRSTPEQQTQALQALIQRVQELEARIEALEAP
ncbi:hypothetical protein [Kiloniella antarctica]|uniref:Uncharacterized protein n=1 Tax=Kiloniella antarctica TaxID=1550907 RepID=A0ABW5BM32_9PROT